MTGSAATEPLPAATGGPGIDDVRRWLAAVLPGSDEPVVRSIERLSRGVSRETWAIELDGGAAGGPVRRLVLRRDLPGGSIDASSLRQEYEIYRCLQATDVPVVGVVTYDDDVLLQGRPAYLREHLDGHWMPEHYDDRDPCYDELRADIGRRHVEALAAVHSVDWQAIGLGDVLRVPADATNAAHDLIDHHRALVDASALAAHPIVTRGIAELERTAPPARRLCLVKGTNGLGEEIFDGSTMVAMSDWELAAIGDPAYDFAQLQGFVDRVEHRGTVVWSLDHALRHYAELTGHLVTKDEVRWYRRFYGLIMFAFATRAARFLAEGRNLQARLAWVATEMQYHGQARLAATFAPDRRSPSGSAA